MPQQERLNGAVRAALGTAAACAVLFALIAADVLRGGALPRLDGAAATWFHRHAGPPWTAFFEVLTTVHSLAGMGIAGVLLGLVFRRLHARRWLLLTAVAVPGGMLLNVLLKYSFTRARPVFIDPIETLATYSFPSGHTAATTVFYGIVVAYLCGRNDGAGRRWRRAALCAAGLLMAALVGLSRIYLGLHFVSDVLAALAESGAWLALCFAAMWRFQARAQARARPSTERQS